MGIYCFEFDLISLFLIDAAGNSIQRQRDSKSIKLRRFKSAYLRGVVGAAQHGPSGGVWPGKKFPASDLIRRQSGAQVPAAINLVRGTAQTFREKYRALRPRRRYI